VAGAAGSRECACTSYLRRLRRGGELEADAALAPFAVLGDDIFGDEGDLGVLADEVELWRAGLRGDEGEVGGAVGRSDGDPAAARLNAGIKDQLEAKLIEVEGQAFLEVANKYRHRLEAQVGVLAVQANG